MAAVSLWAFAAYSKGLAAKSTEYKDRVTIWLQRCIAVEFADKALDGGYGADSTTAVAMWDPPSSPLPPDEMSYDCDANLGAPSAVNCANIDRSQLGAPSDTIMIGPGAPKVLALGECNVAVSADSHIVIGWDQVRWALEGLLLFCVSRPWKGSVGGRAYHNAQPDFAVSGSVKKKKKRAGGGKLSGKSLAPTQLRLE